MWNLSGDDIERAKTELKGRRAAIQAQYDSEMKKLDADLANLEMFERAAMSFVSSYKGAEEAPAATVQPAPAAEAAGAAAAVPEAIPGREAPAEAASEGQPIVASAEKMAGEKGSSRWRMRLNSGDSAS